MPMYTVEVGIVGVSRVEVEADDEDSAMEKAEDCVSPLTVKDWTCIPDWAVLTKELGLATHA